LSTNYLNLNLFFGVVDLNNLEIRLIQVEHPLSAQDKDGSCDISHISGSLGEVKGSQAHLLYMSTLNAPCLFIAANFFTRSFWE
jgi:hypothetical protein